MNTGFACSAFIVQGMGSALYVPVSDQTAESLSKLIICA